MAYAEPITDSDRDELEAYRSGHGQLAFDNPARGPLFPECPDDPVSWYRQSTYRGEPAWVCADCVKLTLGCEPAKCDGCGNADTLTAVLDGPYDCATVARIGGPCPIAGSDGCECPEEVSP
jgi:hypothetical protein